MKVRFLVLAKQDMQSIKIYISKENPQAAIRLIKKFRKSTEKLADFPYSGRVIPELENPDLREEFVSENSRKIHVIEIFQILRPILPH